MNDLFVPSFLSQVVVVAAVWYIRKRRHRPIKDNELSLLVDDPKESNDLLSSADVESNTEYVKMNSEKMDAAKDPESASDRKGSSSSFLGMLKEAGMSVLLDKKMVSMPSWQSQNIHTFLLFAHFSCFCFSY